MDNKEVGKLVREYRNKAGLSQEQLAEKVGTSKAAISFLETGIKGVNIKTLNRIADALGYDLRIRFIKAKKVK